MFITLFNPSTMAQYNIEGDIDNINERQLQFINDVIKEHGFDNRKVTFERVGIAGDNFMANIKRITIEGEQGVISIIAKIAPSNEIFRRLINAHVVFSNEHIMYTEVLPKFVQLQKNADVPEEEQLKYAKCYGSLTEQPNEVILLEDLKSLNYIMLDKFTPLLPEYVKSMLKNFAIYHSLSFVLKSIEPETYDYVKENLIDIWTLPNAVEETQLFLHGLEEDALAVLEEAEHVNLVKNKIIATRDLALKLEKADNDSKYSVLLQGDSWTNNIMFKFEEDILLGSIMIDYQLSRNGNPVHDLMYFIFNCTDYESRKQHFYDWIDYYHAELEKSLSNFSLKANYVYPRDKLDADLKRYAKLSFGLAITLASVLTRKSSDAQKILDVMKTGDVAQQSKEFRVEHLDDDTRALFKNRVIGLVKSFKEFGLL